MGWKQSGDGWICDGWLDRHEPTPMTVESYGWKCPTCGQPICRSEGPKYEPAGPDDPHPGELFRYPAWNLWPGQEMVMYRGGETWQRARGEEWTLIKPWRVPQPTQH